MADQTNGSKLNNGGSNTRLFVAAVLGCCLITVISILAIALFGKPGDTSTGTIIIGIMTPITMAFLGAAVYGVYHATNSRLTQLLDVTASSSLAEGKRLGPDQVAPKGVTQ